MIATNIQRFSLHDGPGIRTTVFLKGCSLHCPWCSNPENQKPNQEKYIKDGKEGIYGKNYSVDEIFNEVMKDKIFYENGGGVTFSGGEALLQAEELLPLLQKFKQEGVEIVIETCLFVSEESLRLVLPYIDYFYVDMKIMDEQKCNEIEGGNLQLYRRNLDILSKDKKITIRIPVIGGYTDNENNRKLVIEEIAKRQDSIVKIELIKEHNFSVPKYKSLGLPLPVYMGVSDKLMEQYKCEIKDAVGGVSVEVCKL